MKRPQLALLGAALVVAVAGLAGFLLGHRGGSSESQRGAAAQRLVESGPFAVRAPADWREPRNPIVVPGLVLEDQIALSPPAAGSRSALIVGVARADDSSLLSAHLRQRMGFAAPTGAARLAGLEALHYDNLQILGGSGPVELYASPIRDGALTAACVGGGAGFRRSCETAVATLRLTRGESYKLGADLGFAQALDQVLQELNVARERGAVAMRRSRRPAQQATAARSVADAFGSAARQVRVVSHNPASARIRTGVVVALTGAENAWRRLAIAAGDERVERYEVARFFVRSSESWVGAVSRKAVEPGGAVPIAPPAQSTPARVAVKPAADSKPCSSTHVAYAEIPKSGRGHVRVCMRTDGTSRLVVSISHLVIAVRHDGHATPVNDAPGSLSDQVARLAAPVKCAVSSCILPPGASVQLDGVTPGALTFAPVFEESVSVVITTGVARELEDRTMPYPKRRLEKVVACVEGVQSTLESQNPEEVALRTLGYGPGCKKVVTDAIGTDDPVKRQSFARDVAKRVRGFAGGALNEGLLVALRTGIRWVP